nr:GNAT family N-acetyltransferase [Agromyces terreus]
MVTRHSIRPAGPADAAALADLAADTFPLACPPSTTPEAIAEFIATNFTVARFEGYLADDERMLVVAERGADDVDGGGDDGDGEGDGHGTGALVGYAMLIAGDPADADVAAAVTVRPTIELSKFYTRKTAHGSGAVAGPLMEAAIEAARARGAASVWLGVNEENARAIRFYEKHGFAKAGRKRFKLGDRYEDDWVLVRADFTAA